MIFFGEQAILITYCPLCGTAIAFDRTIDGDVVEFGTSGMLYNSNLVMYDRKTDSLWNQVGARAIVGELTGHRLDLVPSNTVTWGEWHKEHPDTLVLTRDTGFARSYGRDPYSGYEDSRSLFFPVDEQDDRLHPKAVVYGIEINGKFKAYADENLGKGETVQDTFSGMQLEIKKDESSIITIRNLDSGEEIPFERGFWFSWFAFHPDTELF